MRIMAEIEVNTTTYKVIEAIERVLKTCLPMWMGDVKVKVWVPRGELVKNDARR